MQTPPLSFLQNKIAAIGTALFFCEDQSMLPFSAYMVTALKTDDQGYIWFVIGNNWNKGTGQNHSSAASLDFYRKGYPYSLKIEGQVSLVNDEAVTLEFMQDLLGKSLPVKQDYLAGILLVKVKIENAICAVLAERKTYKTFGNITSVFRNLKHPFNTSLQPSI